MTKLPALVVLAAAGVLLAGCGGSSKKTVAATTTNANGCVPVQSVHTSERSAPKPEAPLDTTKTYEVTFFTNCGDFTIRLDPKQSPNAAASFVSLARRGFFDHTPFHRIVPGFIVQGGDPTATGTSGPGYTTLDKPPADAKYVHGVVAMAKTSVQPAGTAGSQFFVVTAPDSGLTPDYAIIGRVVRGLDVVDRIGKLGETNGQPIETVEIERATVKVHE